MRQGLNALAGTCPFDFGREWGFLTLYYGETLTTLVVSLNALAGNGVFLRTLYWFTWTASSGLNALAGNGVFLRNGTTPLPCAVKRLNALAGNGVFLHTHWLWYARRRVPS